MLLSICKRLEQPNTSGQFWWTKENHVWKCRDRGNYGNRKKQRFPQFPPPLGNPPLIPSHFDNNLSAADSHIPTRAAMTFFEMNRGNTYHALLQLPPHSNYGVVHMFPPNPAPAGPQKSHI